MNTVNYKKLRFNNIISKDYRHLLMLIFWPLYGLAFAGVERLVNSEYSPIFHPLDNFFPFCEWFAIPYVFWYLYLAGMVFYTLFFDVPLFKKFMWFIIIGYSISFIAYLCYPNGQDLRPNLEELGRENVLTQLMSTLYSVDTNTNVCPSMHVIGSMAVMFAAWHSKHFSKWYWLIIFTATALLINISTVYVKQHSIVDVWVGMVISAILYLLTFHIKWGRLFKNK